MQYVSSLALNKHLDVGDLFPGCPMVVDSRSLKLANEHCLECWNNRISGVSFCLRRHQPVCLVRDSTAANWDSNSHRVASIFPSKSSRRLWDRYPTMVVTPFNCLSSLLVTFSSSSARPSLTFNHHCPSLRRSPARKTLLPIFRSSLMMPMQLPALSSMRLLCHFY